MAYTAPKTWTAGAALTAAELNEQIRDNEIFLKAALTTINQTSDSVIGQLKSAAYGCVVKRTANQNITNATDTGVTFPTADMTEELDSDAFHSGATNTARLTIPAGGAGWYDLGADILFEANSTGRREAWVELNGTAGTGTPIIKTIVDAPGSGVAVLNISGPYLLAAGDYVTLNAYQNSTVTLTVQSTGYSVRFWALRRFAV